MTLTPKLLTYRLTKYKILFENLEIIKTREQKDSVKVLHIEHDIRIFLFRSSHPEYIMSFFQP